MTFHKTSPERRNEASASRLIYLTLLAIAASAFAIAWLSTTRYALRPRTLQYDFVPFVCGAHVTLLHADPYTIEPLRSCEHAISTIFGPGSLLVVPAPLPPYVFPVLSIFATLPFVVARVAWLILQLAAYAGTVRLLARLTNLTVSAVLSATFFGALYPSLTLGQVVPFSLLGLSLVGRAIEQDNRLRCVVGLLLLSFEPHLALPVYLAVACLAKNMRVATVGAALLLAIASLALEGPSLIIEYIVRVLPAHLSSEIGNEEQFGVPFLFHALGFDRNVAIDVGKATTFLTLLGGIALGARLCRTTRRRAFIAFAPAALALFGATFLHIQQFAVALPFALLIFSCKPARAVGIGLSLLSVPWGFFYSMLPFAPFASAAFGANVHRFARASTTVAISTVGGALAVLAGSELLRPLSPQHFPWDLYRNTDTHLLSETLWSALIDRGFHGAVWLYLAMKIPTFLGLALITLSAIRYSTRSPEPAQIAKIVSCGLKEQSVADNRSGWARV